VTETTVSTDLLQTFKIVAHLGVDTVGENLKAFAIDDVLLPVQEPCRNFELRRVLNDGNETLKLIRVELAGALVEVDISLLADQVGVTTANTLDFGQGVHDLAFAVNVGVEETQDVLKLNVGLGDDERHIEEGMAGRRWFWGWVNWDCKQGRRAEHGNCRMVMLWRCVIS